MKRDLSTDYKIGDEIECLSSRDLRQKALSLSAKGYGVAVIGFYNINEHVLTVTALPENKE